MMHTPFFLVKVNHTGRFETRRTAFTLASDGQITDDAQINLRDLESESF